MIKTNYIKLITEILGTKDFKNGLSSINNLYPNLKQEGPIRNLILEELNKHFKKSNENIPCWCTNPFVYLTYKP